MLGFQEKPVGDGAWINGGFWQPMDSLRDKMQLEALWSGGRAPWRARTS